MEVLANFLNPTQIGHLRDVTKSVSLDDVTDMATTGFRSMSTNREDSLVFVLGLLNLGTVLCYAVYSQLLKPNRRGSAPVDDNQFIFKKIQTILDELVLHVHTTTYYRSSLEKSQELAKGRSVSSPFQARSGSPSMHSVFNFFDLPEPTVYGEKEPPPLPLSSSKRSAEDFQEYLQGEAKKWFQEWLSFLVQSDLPDSSPSTGHTIHKRHTSLSFPRIYRRNTTTTSATRQRSTPTPVPLIKKRVGSLATPLPTKSADAKTSAEAPQTKRTPMNRERASPKSRPQIKQPVAAANGAEADGRSSASSSVAAATAAAAAVPAMDVSAATSSSRATPDVPRPAHQDVPVLPVHALFPHDTVRTKEARSSSSSSSRRTDSNTSASARNSKNNRISSRSGLRSRNIADSRERNEVVPTTIKSTPVEPRHIPSEFRQQLYRIPSQAAAPYDMDDSASMSSVTKPEDEDNLIGRLMHMIQQTAPLAMDVLSVFKSRGDGQQSAEPKCLERLLCQLNQDWKGRGSVPAAMAPFLSISMGWLLERSTAPNLSHILMAVRAGWIGKHCATLYPRCANPGRPQWTVTPLHDDSLNLPSIGQPLVKVRPPLDFFSSTSAPPTIHLDSTLRPQSSSLRTPSTKPQVSHSSESSESRTTPSPSTVTSGGIKKVDKGPPDWVREGSQSQQTRDPVVKGIWGQQSIELDEEQQTSSTLIGTSLQVDRNGAAGSNTNGANGGSNERVDSPKPWGKPSRFAGSDDLELSDIVRGVYPQKATNEEEEDDEYDGDEEEEDEEGEDEDAEDDDNNEEEHEVSTKKTVPQHTDQDSILHDLNKNHFAEKPVAESHTKIKDIYEELQKKKTDRLEMVPHRGLVHPWLSEPVWAPENTWQSKVDFNRLRSDEELDDGTDRHRDRVSFSHEDAVKDVRLFDFAMQYLRDRSA